MKVLISILFLMLANSSFAEDDMRYYDIEVIILENIAENARNAENWPLQVNLTQPEKIIELGQPFLSEWLPKDVDLNSSYKVLPKNFYQLNDLVQKIVNSKNQRVIFHTAWRQPGLDKNQALPIYFKHDVPAQSVSKNENTNELNQNSEESLSLNDTQESEPVASVLEGVLRVTLARYLHLEAELTYQKKTPPISINDNPFAALDDENINKEMQKQGVVHLKQKRRRIRSNELHYVDHPVLGILIRITRYEKPEEVVSKNQR